MDRERAITAAIERIRDDLGGLESVHAAAVDEVTSSETKSEGKYDTRSTEASYLARGQAERVAALRQLLTWMQAQQGRRSPGIRVALGSLVELLADDDTTTFVLVAPDGGGRRLRVDGEDLLLVTPKAPMGQQLVGCSAGDAVEVPTPRTGPVSWEIVTVG